MADLKSDTMGSFNSFIKEQKEVEGEAIVTLVTFNTKIEKVYESSIQEAGLLTNNNYSPKSMTRLYDAIGSTIKDIKSRIKDLDKSERPEKVLFVIITDGLENRSREYNRSMVFEMISKREKKGWNFIYLGANQDAMAEGGKIGINKFNTVTWVASADGVKTALKSASLYATQYRSTSTANFDADLNKIYKEEESKSKS